MLTPKLEQNQDYNLYKYQTVTKQEFMSPVSISLSSFSGIKI